MFVLPASEDMGKGGSGGHASPVVYKFSPITNADRIRGMSDEELAGWIYTHRWNDFDGLLDWLKQEVTANDS